MGTLSIITAPDPRLRVASEPVARVDDSLRALMDGMLAAMYAAPGVGLSAVQVGVPKRVIVLDVARKDEPPAPLRLINPEVLWLSDDLVGYEEGCLSFPDHYVEIDRPADVRLAYVDETEAMRELHASGLLSRCIQHEIDHLEGVLLVDHVSALKRNIILRKLIKAKKADTPKSA